MAKGRWKEEYHIIDIIVIMMVMMMMMMNIIHRS